MRKTNFILGFKGQKQQHHYHHNQNISVIKEEEEQQERPLSGGPKKQSKPLLKPLNKSRGAGHSNLFAKLSFHLE